ncbi:MAG TPA: hypothetical protein VF546_05210 [Pyrinomonadaceae bacterium]|jgi:hypothetical protein
MKTVKSIIAVLLTLRRVVAVFLLLLALGGLSVSAQTHRRRAPRRARTAPVATINSRLTGTYRLDTTRSEDARSAADRATRNLPAEDRQRVLDDVLIRLESPDALVIERRENNITIASTNAPRVAFTADGEERSEYAENGGTVRTRATLYGDRLDIGARGDRSSTFDVTIESLDGGRRLGVTRQIFAEQLDQPIVVRSFYDRTSNLAQWNTYGSPQAYPGGKRTDTTTTNFFVPDGTRLVAVLNQDLSTKQSRDHDAFTLTVREPAQYAGATIEGYVTGVTQSGRITGRSQMTLNFQQIRLSNGRTYKFAGVVDSVRTNGQTVRVDNEGNVESESQTTKTGGRGAIGTGVGAIIGAIAGGAKGAVIGAIVGAGAGAGSVYAQGEENLELRNGTELTIHASAPGSNR